MLINHLSLCCFVIGLLALVQNTISCPRQQYLTNGGVVEWEEVITENPTLHLSRPICFDENDNITTRLCSVSKWIPEKPEDCKRTPTDEYHCPKGFQTFEQMCLKITDSQQWTDKVCFGSDTILSDVQDDQIFLNYLLRNNLTKFWVPAKRSDVVNSAVYWRLPGNKWGEILQISNRNSLPSEVCAYALIEAVRNSRKTKNTTAELKIKFGLADCNENLHFVCINRYSAFEQIACPNNYLALKHMPDECFGIHSVGFEPNDPSYENFLHLRDNNVFKVLADHNRLDSSRLCLAYEYEIDSLKTPIVINWLGTLIPFQFYDCVINSLHIIPDRVPKMILSFDANQKNLLLTVYNLRRLWHQSGSYGITCLTYSDNNLIKRVDLKVLWQDKYDRKTIFEVDLPTDTAAVYWCEAHTIFNFEFQQTPRIIAYRKQKGHAFAFFYELPCTFNTNYKTIIKKLILINRKKINDELYRRLIIHNVRILNVETIKNHLKKVLCHVSISLKKKSNKIKLSNRNNNSNEDENNNEGDDENIIDDDDESEEDTNDDEDTFMENLTELKNMLYVILNYGRESQQIQVNSTEFCLPEYSKAIERTWQGARIGQTTTTSRICLLSNYLPIYRKCIGDFIYGAKWEAEKSNISCQHISDARIVTSNLYNIGRSITPDTNPTQTLNQVKSLLSATSVSSSTKLIPADLFYLGRIMKIVATNIAKDQPPTNGDSLKPSELLPSQPQSPAVQIADIVTIYNYLMDVDSRITRTSVKLNSTNILLDAFETLINEISTKSNDENSTTTSDYHGVVAVIGSKLMAFIIDPRLTNITGVALYTENCSYTSLHNSRYRFLFSNQSYDEILDEEGLEVATFVPERLLQLLDEEQIIPNKKNSTSNQTQTARKIIINIFFNDLLFQEDRDFTDKKVLGKIISISISGVGSHLPELMPIFVKGKNYEDNMNSSDLNGNKCSYWNYDTWMDDGIEFLNKSDNGNDIILYGCSHFTPFAYLVGGYYNLSTSTDVVVVTRLHEEALDIITILGCSLSLAGILGIIVTAIAFRSWRQKASSKVLLQLSAAIALQMILICFVNTEVLTTHLIENKIYSSCIALGASLHYSVLVQFSWMLIVAYLQYKRYVQVLGSARPNRFFFKAFLLGWCLPCIPVFIVLLIDRDAYIPFIEFSQSKICYPSGRALYLGVIMPIGLIIVANLVIFITVIYYITHGHSQKIQKTEKQLALSQLRLSVFLFFLLGFTWIFGLLASTRAGLVFSYLFCLTATLQGFVLFIYFIVLDPVTRKLWSNFFRKLFCKEQIK